MFYFLNKGNKYILYYITGTNEFIYFAIFFCCFCLPLVFCSVFLLTFFSSCKFEKFKFRFQIHRVLRGWKRIKTQLFRKRIGWKNNTYVQFSHKEKNLHFYMRLYVCVCACVCVFVPNTTKIKQQTHTLYTNKTPTPFSLSL